MDQIDGIIKQWERERSDLDVAPMETIGRINRLNQYFMRRMEETWSLHDLTPAGFDVLATLRRAGEPYSLSPGDLLSSTMVTSGTMTHRVDRLEKAGLVERRKNPDDGRGFLICLTSKGYGVIDEAISDHVTTQASLVAEMTAKQQSHLNQLLRLLLREFEPVE
ncbi:MarR family transcriptional regulator [uncultured Alcanivorax sp.]|jgi:DNA-binding MarR family transcriptional regulator|uniref:MarR family winged helix-turn-helix transcriptional regulator n=1 Tax=uncultured Alcanivorax sp. TaxID=191215 RepID=UPI0025886587|nr:MarR family transcriptional regulator [uncultured Alcanivorax sp.]